jgi:two-component system, cell cycle sensor histidine kinase and response regulator CckA
VSAAVLVVDDETTVLRLIRIALEREGLRVLTAGNGVEALAVLAGAERVDLVVTDVVMPQMDGIALAGHVREMAAAPRLIFMSGFVNDRSRLNAALGRPAPFVQKPFDLEVMMATVRAELRGTPPAGGEA